ncbi:hypothetical protein MNV49_007597 [Pseudohyphozyma bogoriensis]|nr:hypothetical protein MNV49_007597 [Pseudohyphozyma bogoriensis]
MPAQRPKSSVSTSRRASQVKPTESSRTSDTYPLYEPRRRFAGQRHSPKVLGILKGWYDKNVEYPYPTEQVKARLMAQTGLDKTQLNNWFINYRRRSTCTTAETDQARRAGKGRPSTKTGDKKEFTTTYWTPPTKWPLVSRALPPSSSSPRSTTPESRRATDASGSVTASPEASGVFSPVMLANGRKFEECYSPSEAIDESASEVASSSGASSPVDYVADLTGEHLHLHSSPRVPTRHVQSTFLSLRRPLDGPTPTYFPFLDEFQPDPPSPPLSSSSSSASIASSIHTPPPPQVPQVPHLPYQYQTQVPITQKSSNDTHLTSDHTASYPTALTLTHAPTIAHLFSQPYSAPPATYPVASSLVSSYNNFTHTHHPTQSYSAPPSPFATAPSSTIAPHFPAPTPYYQPVVSSTNYPIQKPADFNPVPAYATATYYPLSVPTPAPAAPVSVPTPVPTQYSYVHVDPTGYYA